MQCDEADVPEHCPVMCGTCNNTITVIDYDPVVSGLIFPITLQVLSTLAGSRIYVMIDHPDSPGRNYVGGVRVSGGGDFQAYLNDTTGAYTLNVEVSLQEWLVTPRSGYRLVAYLSQPTWARRDAGFASSGRQGLTISPNPLISATIIGNTVLPWRNGFDGAPPQITLNATYTTSRLYDGNVDIIVLLTGPEAGRGYLNQRRTTQLASLPSSQSSQLITVALGSWVVADADYSIVLALVNTSYAGQIGRSTPLPFRLVPESLTIAAGSHTVACKLQGGRPVLTLQYSTNVLLASDLIAIVSNSEKSGWVRSVNGGGTVLVPTGVTAASTLLLELQRWAPTGNYTVHFVLKVAGESWSTRYLRSGAYQFAVEDGSSCVAGAEVSRLATASEPAGPGDGDDDRDTSTDASHTAVLYIGLAAGAAIVVLAAVAATYVIRKPKRSTLEALTTPNVMTETSFPSETTNPTQAFV